MAVSTPAGTAALAWIELWDRWAVRHVLGAGICFTEWLTGNTDAAPFLSVQRKLYATAGYRARSSHGNNALSNYNYKSSKVSAGSGSFDMDKVALCLGRHGLREARRKKKVLWINFLLIDLCALIVLDRIGLNWTEVKTMRGGHPLCCAQCKAYKNMSVHGTM